jgi:solute carrier family 25 phosphate transporter 23/24/25/41
MKLWMGNGASCMKIAPEIGIKLVSFDLIKNRIAQDPSNISVGERFLAGGLAGVISQLSIYPMEVLKTRLAIAHPGAINGAADCAIKNGRKADSEPRTPEWHPQLLVSYRMQPLIFR